MVLCNAALVVIDAIKGTSRDRICRELDLNHLLIKVGHVKSFLFTKYSMNFHLYIYNYALITVVKEFVKQGRQIKTTLNNFLQEQKYLSHLFFFIILSEELRKTDSTVQFKTKILSFIRPKEDWILSVHDADGINLLNRLRLHLCHLNEQKFRHNFRATIDLMCSCGLEPETTLLYLLRCNIYSELRIELLKHICALNPTLKNLSH